MKKFIAVVFFVVCSHYAHATNCPVSAGAAQSTITSIIGGCGSGNTVTFAAGTYTWTSTYTLPCGVSLQGVVPASKGGTQPTYSQTPNQTTKFTGNFGTGNYGPLRTTAGCSSSQSILYIEWDGQRPGTGQNLNPGSSYACRSENNNYPEASDLVCGIGGGNFIFITPGTQNFTMEYNYIHGNNCGYLCGDTHSSLVYMGSPGGQNGCCTYPNGYPVDSNINISWNILSAAGDCAAAVNYNDNNQNTEGGGGTCNGVSMQAAFTNLTVSNNRFITGDDELKFYELYTNGGQGAAAGGSAGYCSPCTFNYNHFQQFDRIAQEMQINWGGSSEPTLVYSQWSDWSNHLVPMQQDYDLSMANGCLTGFNTPGEIDCVNHVDYNMSVADTPTAGYGIPGFEYWGGNGSTGNGNFWSGSYNYISFQWDPNGNYTFNNNTVMTTENNGNAGGWGCVLQNGQSNPAYGSTNPQAAYTGPSCNNNYYTTSNGTITSVAPVLSFSGGVVTITNSNVSTPNGSNPGRDSNTTFWCTTDGSTPGAGTGTSIPYWNGPLNSAASQTSFVANVTTIGSGTFKCIGMWGAPNQPYSYPTPANKGGGYVPSAVASIAYSNGPTTAEPQITPAGGGTFTTAFNVAITDTTAGATIYYTTDGSTPTNGSTVYTAPFSVSGSTTTVQAIGISSGNANSAIASAVYTYVPPPSAFYGPTTQTETNSGSNAYFTANVITVLSPLTVATGNIYLGAGGTVGDKVDILIVPATGYNTEAATPSCYSTFTETSGTINAFQTLLFSSCTLQPGNYWLGYQTNDPGLAIGSYDCGGSPSAPTCVTGSAGYTNPSTYGLWYVPQAYGTYTGLVTTFAGQAGVQQSIYLTGANNTTATPVIFPATGSFTTSFNAAITDGTSGSTIYYTTDGSTPTTASLVYSSAVPISGVTTTLKAVATSPGNAISSVVTVVYTYTGGGSPTITGCQITGASSVAAGAVIQGSSTCTYSSGSPTNCGVSPDSYGNVVNVWSAASPTIFTVGNYGAPAGCTVLSQGPGCVRGVSIGSANLGGSIGSLQCTPLSIMVTHTLTGLSIATTGSITSLQSGSTNQLIPTCTYSDSTTDHCSSFTITYTTSNSSFATVTANGGLVTAVSAGSVNLGASIASPSVSASPLSLTITPPTSHIIFNQTGVAGFKGNASVQ